jgi:glycyl-tRNA synthetase beta chain
MAELLVELRSEEIPARMQPRAAADFKSAVVERMEAAQLPFAAAESYVTPRRLVLVVDGLPERQPDLREEKRGPRVGAPDQAIQGFLKANGLTSLDQCEKRAADKGEFWFAYIERKGCATADVLPEILEQAALALPWPKSMRWSDGTVRWVRPLSNALGVFDGKPLKGTLLGLSFNATTRGHRFQNPAAFEVTSFRDYREKLHAAHVILDPAERQRVIREGADARAKEAQAKVKDDPALLGEVAGLVEYPVVLMGGIDEQFMDVPEEVLITSMRAHQKYFALLDGAGKLAPRFIVVANIEAPDGGKAIVAGNERVLRARLSDAKFFWDLDRKRRLEERVPQLADLIFHARLGTVGQKTARLELLAGELAAFIPGCDRNLARSAALLAKADLKTGMVGEFPELQGIMGRYYALAEGEKPEIANAIADHYAPAGPSDRCPTAPVSIAVALADKIDTLFWFFAIDEKPTGSKDPFALRRAALGVIRLVLENKLRLPLRQAFELAWRGKAVAIDEVRRDVVIGELLEFFADRLKAHLREAGVRHDLVTAVFSLTGEDDFVRLMARVDALGRFLTSGDGANLLTAYRRAANIVRIEERKDKTRYDGAVDEKALAQPEETELGRRLREASESAAKRLGTEDFAGAMAALSALREPVDAFFDKVTVNADDAKLRANRLKLLSQIRMTMNQVADFSQIEG